ncbi:MAG: Rrf2 family transcriptional regulator [Myxococcota bacterium]|nr:Rrf2 family transcriptional regulator [Myxococcota bacterium]
MKISSRCRYAALALFDIAFHNDGQPTQVKQIAKRQNIPGRFLEQIFQDLRRAELVDGKRGRNGGYFLNRSPSDINLLDVIHATEGEIELAKTAKQSAQVMPSSSPIETHDILIQAWDEVGQQISDIYAAISLADLVERAELAGLSRSTPGYMYFI